jgi:hypothetical protein
MSKRTNVFQAAAITLVSMLAACGAMGQTFSNTAAIVIPNQGNANPYPSTINVIGGPTSIEFVTVTLNGLTHSFFGDLRMLLVGPGGQKIQLMNTPFGSASAPGFTVSYVTAGAQGNTNDIAGSGFYLPSGGSVGLPAPAPGTPYGE